LHFTLDEEHPVMALMSCLLMTCLGVHSPGGSPGSAPEGDDWHLSNRARSVLWEDSRLTSLLLDVVVVDGVASLYGPVPSEELRLWAGEVTERIEGIREVRNHVRVRTVPGEANPRPRTFPPVDAPRPPKILEQKPILPETRAPSRPAENAPTHVTSHSPAAAASARTPPPASWQPAATGPVPPASLPRSARPPATLTQRTSTAPTGSWQPLAPVNSQGTSTFAVPVDANPRVSLRVASLLRNDPRFRQVTATVSGRQVRLRGTVRNPEELAELVRLVGALPEVEQVIPENVLIQKALRP
jgi:osmotically-inducible protein OsmY